MLRWSFLSATLLVVALASGYALGQDIATVPATTATTAATAAAPAAPKNLFSFLCPTPEQCKQCRDHLCSCTLAPLIGGMLAPARAFSGGLVPDLCPGPNDANPNNLNKPADSAEGAADRIKAKEAGAKARRAAVRYLGTVDCRRYPEAEAALINSLLGDENECVRFEAASALRNGCCCTKKIIQALTMTVSGQGGNHPPETSPRVKYAAEKALERCLACYCEIDEPPAPPERPIEEKEPAGGTPPERPGGTPRQKDERPCVRLSPDASLEQARRVLTWRRERQHQAAITQQPQPQPTHEPALLDPRNEGAIRQTVQLATLEESRSSAREVPQSNSDDGPREQLAPPTGKRDVWNLFRQALRSR